MCAKPYYDGEDKQLSPIEEALKAQKEAREKSKALEAEIELVKAETSPERTEYARQIAEVWSMKIKLPSLNRVLDAYKGRGLNSNTLAADLEAQGLPKNIIDETVRYYNQMGRVGK